MKIDPENPVVKLCAQGMMLEGEGKDNDALNLFLQAWKEATDDFDRFIAAHYVARHQKSIMDKLAWDQTALQSALKVKGEDVNGSYPSLYLNIAKCHEDLKDFDNAKRNYQLAFSYIDFLLDDGYGKMIRRGIVSGMERIGPAMPT